MNSNGWLAKEMSGFISADFVSNRLPLTNFRYKKNSIVLLGNTISLVDKNCSAEKWLSIICFQLRKLKYLGV